MRVTVVWWALNYAQRHGGRMTPRHVRHIMAGLFWCARRPALLTRPPSSVLRPRCVSSTQSVSSSCCEKKGRKRAPRGRRRRMEGGGIFCHVLPQLPSSSMRPVLCQSANGRGRKKRKEGTSRSGRSGTVTYASEVNKRATMRTALLINK